MPGFSIDDLDLNSIQALFSKGSRFSNSKSMTEETLLTLKLLSLYQNKLVPTKGAILLFLLNRVTYTIPEKPTSRLQKYRLSDEGRRHLKQP